MFLFGGVSGLIATMIVYPFDLVKTILCTQKGQQFKGIFRTIFEISHSQGPF